MIEQTPPQYAFGPFRLDVRRRRLFRDDDPVPLTPKAFDTLVVLVQCAGRTVSKDELMQQVWPGTTVEENNLTQAISRLRKVLGDSPEDRSHIVTVPGQGYRFVSVVHASGAVSQTLAERLKAGPVFDTEAASLLLAVLTELEQVHRDGHIHGRVTPSTILVGGKVSLSSAAAGTDALDDVRYLAPEQIQGDVTDQRTDLFSAGAILFEMLAGRPAFPGNSRAAIERSILTGFPPSLGGSRTAAAIDAVIHRAMAKKPRDRYAAARAMADALRDAVAGEQPARTHAHPVTRLIVLPFRVLRPDPETDFLAFSLPDAITSSLTGLESLVVRSSLTAARFGATPTDLKALAADAAVDLVLTGTLLRQGDEIRVNTQLVEVQGGAVLSSSVSQAPPSDVFRLQDDLTRRIIERLPVALSARDAELVAHHAPRDPRAYQLYLQANELAYDPRHWTVARDLYRACLDGDPQYAPAWARLGRVYRLLALYAGDDATEYYRLAQHAFRRALDLNPDLPLAHNLYTHLEVELGGAHEAMLRLIRRARSGFNDPDIFAGLVHACRYCGLLDAAVVAYERARRLDPDVRTSVAHAYWMLGDYERAIETDLERPPVTQVLSLIATGREAEAVALLVSMEKLEGLPLAMHHYIVALRALLQGRRQEYVDAAEAIPGNTRVWDPCGRFYVARLLARVGDLEQALTQLRGAVEGGFCCVSILTRDAWLDELRPLSEFARIIDAADARHRRARGAFIEAGADRLLGLALH